MSAPVTLRYTGADILRRGSRLTMNMMTPTEFRTALPEFNNATKWPDATIENALYEAEAETGGSGWGAYENVRSNFRRRGMVVYAAAWLINMYGDGGPSSTTSGEARLNVASKSVGDESVAYRVPSMLEVNNDWLTWSHYGQQFYRLRKRAGMGARCV